MSALFNPVASFTYFSWQTAILGECGTYLGYFVAVAASPIMCLTIITLKLYSDLPSCLTIGLDLLQEGYELLSDFDFVVEALSLSYKFD